MRYIFLLWLLLGAITISRAQPNGWWQGQMMYKQSNVPFTFSWQQQSDSTASVTFKNGQEELTTIAAMAGDSVRIPLFVFDAELVAHIAGSTMSGQWIKHYKPGNSVPFKAYYAKPRFAETTGKPASINGIWNMPFTQPSGTTSKAMGIFNQQGVHVTGTIATPVGDYRFFEGVVRGDSLLISSFDGVHAFLVKGRYSNGRWTGKMYFDVNYAETWQATQAKENVLTNPFEVITVPPATYTPYYDILTAGGTYNAIDTDALQGKVVVIQLMGTWCPNSYDQTQFLTNWYLQQDTTLLKLMAVAYEPGDKAYAANRIKKYKASMHIPYTMYLGGRMSKGQAALAFPNMGKINAFPTLIIIDKGGFIRYIHNYFTGPATGELYQHFKQDFNAKIQALLLE